MPSSSGSWLTEDREIDEAVLTEFLTQAKRIYEAELAGYTEEELSMLQEMDRQQVASAGTAAGSSVLASSEALNMAMGDQLMGTGVVNGMETDFNLLATLADQEERWIIRFFRDRWETAFCRRPAWEFWNPLWKIRR